MCAPHPRPPLRNATSEGLWAGQPQNPAPEGASRGPRKGLHLAPPPAQDSRRRRPARRSGCRKPSAGCDTHCRCPSCSTWRTWRPEGEARARCGRLSLPLGPSGSPGALQPSFTAQHCPTVGRDARRGPPRVVSWPPAQPSPWRGLLSRQISRPCPEPREPASQD